MFPDYLNHKYPALFPAEKKAQTGQNLYNAAVLLLMILSEVFSSNLQSTLPVFCRICRAGLTLGAVWLLLAKAVLFTRYRSRKDYLLIAVILAYTLFATMYGGDRWYFLAALLGIAAKDVDLRSVLRIYLITAVSGLVLVQMLHLVSPELMPYSFYCRNWDFGYGHYNGYGCRILGVFMAWAWLRWQKLRWYDFAGMAAVIVYVYIYPNSRGAVAAMTLLWLLLAAQKLLPALFRTKVWNIFVVSLWSLCLAFSLISSKFYINDPSFPLYRLNNILSGRFSIWHDVWWNTPVTLFGGIASDSGPLDTIDNTFLALVTNKGLVGAVLVFIVYLLLAVRLVKHHRVIETILLVIQPVYLLAENKPFLFSSNPLLLLLPIVFFYEKDKPLPVVFPVPEKETD